MVSESTGVKCSTRCSASLWKSPAVSNDVLSFRFVVSITSVSPSQRPTESPCVSLIVPEGLLVSAHPIVKCIPFKLRVQKVVHSTSEIEVAGELVKGVTAAQKWYRCVIEAGGGFLSPVTPHGVMLMKHWPVVPGDGSQLVLFIASPCPSFELDILNQSLGEQGIRSVVPTPLGIGNLAICLDAGGWLTVR